MRNCLKRIFSGALVLTLLLSVLSMGVLAAPPGGPGGMPPGDMPGGMPPDGMPGGPGGMPPDGMPGGPGGPSDMPPGGPVDGIPDDADIKIDEGKVEAGSYADKVTVDADGKVVISGLDFKGTGYDQTAITVNNNSVAEVKDSTITMDVTEKMTEAPASAGPGPGGSSSMAIGVDNKSTLYITGSKITVNGAGRYTVGAYNDATMVVNDSEIIAGGKKGANGNTDVVSDPFSNAALLVSGTSRANFSIGATHTFYYNSRCIAEGWAALSTDSATGSGLEFVGYDTYAEATNGGYGTYADTNCRDYFFGVTFNAAEVGAIISNNGEIHIGSGADAKGAKTQDGIDVMEYASEGYKVNDAESVIYAERNAFQIHSPDMMGEGNAMHVGVLDVKNSTLTTVPTDELKASSTEDYKAAYGDAVGAYVDYIKGSVILVKSNDASITLDNVKMNSSNGVLIHTIVNSDSMSRFLKGSNEGKGVNVSMSGMDVEGDIVHDDYQRDLTVSLSKANLTGAVTAATADSWYDQWEKYASDEAAYWTTINNDTYNTATHATALSLSDGSVWNVTGDSTLTSLEIKDSSKVVIPADATLTVGGRAYTDTTLTAESGMIGGFSDVPADSGEVKLAEASASAWYSEEVYWAVDNLITYGTGHGKFSPERSCTKAEFLAMLARAAGEDISGSDWKDKAAAWAVEKGFESEGFDINAGYTRLDVVSYIWQDKGSKAPAAEASFSDIQGLSKEQSDAVAWAVENDITKGTGKGTTFSPDKPCTRAEIVAFLSRAYSE